MTPETVAADVAALCARLGGGGPVDRVVERDCSAALDRLRALWRRAPDLFSEATVATLRDVARTLQAGAPRPTGDGQPARASEPPRARDFPPGAAHDALRSIFGYQRFRPGQEEIISAVLAGRDCIGVMPTGAGKSLTYQIPARLLGGTTLVVSPLIALMKDQVDAMHQAGLRATFLNSSLAPEERRERLQGLWSGAYELVYAAPEGLEAGVGSALARTRLSLIAVDEAHCISHWGHDFRTAYRNLAGLKQRFGGVPVLALTATATGEVMRDIVQQLAMVGPAEYRGSFFRPNLRLSAYRKGDGADGDAGGGAAARSKGGVRGSILRLARARAGQSGIIYCLSRKATESTAAFLEENGLRAAAYHAGLPPDERSRTQDAFRRDDIDIVVATVAFGMGIDKPDIRYVIHRDMPRSIEGYYQEIGRAGRDGQLSDCILFYSWADVLSYDRFESDGAPEVAERQRLQAREMFRLADNRGACRHQAVTRYFGERLAPCASSCDVCGGLDVLAEAPATRARRGDTGGGRTRARRELEGEGLVVGAVGEDLDTDDAELFARLRQLRRRLADERGLPAYLVFSDATLREMSRRRPGNAAELLLVPGVGPKKLSEYGDLFLAAVGDPGLG